MFLRHYQRTKQGKTHIYYALVESVRTERGPRQRVIAHLGELNHDQERRWQRTVVFHNRQGDEQQLRLFPDDEHLTLPDDPDIVRIRLGQVSWTNARRFGDVWLARWLWHYLGLDAIVGRHVPQGNETVRPADVVAIEVINRLCQPVSEFALAEHWYRSTALEDLLGVPDAAVTKDRLYRTLDQLLKAQDKIEADLKQQLGTLFQLDYDLLLYDLTSSYFEGLAEDNDLAQRGYSRDHRSDCKQVVIALVLSREGFPLAHRTWAGNTQDLQTVKKIVAEVEAAYGKTNRVWVMDRGMISKDSLAFLSQPGRRYLLSTRRPALAKFQKYLEKRRGWQHLPDNPEVEVRLLRRGKVHYLLARSKSRRAKERAIRRRQRRPFAKALRKQRCPAERCPAERSRTERSADNTLSMGAILRRHGPAFARQYPRTPPGVQRVLARLAACRTAALGGHVTQCCHCGDVRYRYHSCGDRHCPACGGTKRAAWLERRRAELLPVPYFHVVFTLPHQLSALVLGNRRLLYPLLLRTAAHTLLDVAADAKHLGARLGVLAVLHTWGQQLEHHPHVHCVVPGGGLAPDGQRWLACRPNFLLPVKVLGQVFRGKYLEGLRQAYVTGALQLGGSTAALADPSAFAALVDELYRTSWVVYAKQPFGRDPEQVLKYLARYTHRVAFSNTRLVRVDGEEVTFTYKDYADACRTKELTLPALEFVRRFAMHVVPGGLVRIRQYGLLANRGRGERLAQCRRLLTPAPQTARTVAPVAPPTVPDHRWLMLSVLLLATATPADLAHLPQHLLCPTSPHCAVCGSQALHTLWQAPRPSARQLPHLASWTGRCEAQPPVREDTS